MSEKEWLELRAYIEHSGLSGDDVVQAIKDWQRQVLPTDAVDSRQIPLPGFTGFSARCRCLASEFVGDFCQTCGLQP